jgi:hypothetical protein
MPAPGPSRLRLSFYGGLTEGHPGGENGATLAPADFVGLLDDDRREALVRSCQVKQAKYHCFASLLAILACRKARSALSMPADDVGVIACAGSPNTSVAWQLAETLLSRGVDYLNPLYFPNSLASAVACSVAAECQARAFAFGVGYEELAFFEALRLSGVLLRAGRAGCVLIACASDAGPLHRRAMSSAGLLRPPCDVSLCCAVTSSPSSAAGAEVEAVLGPCESLEEIIRSARQEYSVGPGDIYSAVIGERSTMRASYPSSMIAYDAACATCGVMVVEAATASSVTSPDSQRCFLVACQASSASGGVILRRANAL